MPLHLQACHGSSALLRSMLPEGTALRLNRHASAVRLHSDCCSVTAGDVSCDYDVVFLAMPAACARRIVGVYASLDTSQREALALLLCVGGCEQRLAAPPPAALEAVELCSRLPLALSIAVCMSTSVHEDCPLI